MYIYPLIGLLSCDYKDSFVLKVLKRKVKVQPKQQSAYNGVVESLGHGVRQEMLLESEKEAFNNELELSFPS